MDVVLPDSSGLDLAEALRGRMSSQKTPIVIFSSSTNPDHLEKAKACGVSEYRVKPMAPDEYLCAIRDIVHNWMPRRGGKAL
jgi:DNA-binding NarL/FixJ family response regulator